MFGASIRAKIITITATAATRRKSNNDTSSMLCSIGCAIGLHTRIRGEIPEHAIWDEESAQIRIAPHAKVELSKVEIGIEAARSHCHHVRLLIHR